MTKVKVNKQQLTQLIKEEAQNLGFSAVGIIPAKAFTAEETSYLSNWLENNYQADMDWMLNNLDIRKDPSSDKLLPGAQSIVCLAINYFNEENNEISEQAKLQYGTDKPTIKEDGVLIAKYARGSDYHKVIKKRLKQLLKKIQQIDPSIKGRGLTDSAPMPERPLAVKAGLGWVGKNGNLISRNDGSFLFLAQLILTVELDYDEVEQSKSFQYCGTCTRCIEACPTDAIINEGTIDANKCIAYWTIENRTAEKLPEPIADNLNGWVFGCDICQDVCPWNIKFASPTHDPDFTPKSHNQSVNAEEILAMNEEDFNERYQNSPIKRTGLKALQRNIQAAKK